MSEVPYVGHLLTKEGLRPDLSKIEAIRKMSRPRDVKCVPRIVGLANYLTRFLENLADICEPLRQLTRKDSDWHWDEEHQNVFLRIKQVATQAPVLR